MVNELNSEVVDVSQPGSIVRRVAPIGAIDATRSTTAVVIAS
jgi:hypothetical protein